MISLWAQWSSRQRALACALAVLVAGFWYATRPVEPPCTYAVMWPSEDMDADFHLTAAGEAHVEQILAEKRASGERAPIQTRWHGWLD
ncbi:hypothetical protein [Actinacidiphila sp. bgisy167]|uniref:hypothetical protein n=1 Tax=Actinacidiphila sp. bgisy167 TaxID=3413797 RepID=UPI003D72095D